MCQKGNQTIYRACRDALMKGAGVKSMSNKEMRRRLAQLGGCANGHGVVDKPP